MTTTTDKEFKGAAVQTTITNSINSSDAAVSIASATGWPTGAQPFTVVLDRGQSTEEKVLCSSRTGTALTLSTRGYDNTSAGSHSAGVTIEHCIAATDFDALFRHATDTAIDDHTQYMHISTARTITAANTYNEKQQFNMKNASTPAFDIKAAASASVGMVRGYASDGTTKVFEITDAGAVKADGTTSLFGSGAVTGTGSYIEIGDFGDTANAYISAGGGASNVAMIYTSKGTGGHLFKSGSTNTFVVSNGGLASASGGGIFGTGAISSTGKRAAIGDFGDANNVYLQAQDSAANCGIILDAKGASSVAIQTNGGTVQGSFSIPGSANDTSLYVRNNSTLKLVGVGAADSGGAGFKLLRVAN